MSRNGTGKLSYLMTGLGIGTALGVLLAPRSGEETRESIQTGAEEGGEYLARKGRRVYRQAQEYLDSGRQALWPKKPTPTRRRATRSRKPRAA